MGWVQWNKLRLKTLYDVYFVIQYAPSCTSCSITFSTFYTSQISILDMIYFITSYFLGKWNKNDLSSMYITTITGFVTSGCKDASHIILCTDHKTQETSCRGCLPWRWMETEWLLLHYALGSWSCESTLLQHAELVGYLIYKFLEWRFVFTVWVLQFTSLFITLINNAHRWSLLTDS